MRPPGAPVPVSAGPAGGPVNHHPLVGDLHFFYESFQAPGDVDQTLCVYNVEPGSDSDRALRLLNSWTDPRHTVEVPPANTR